MTELTKLTEPVAAAWQESWDRQQRCYMPDREERFAAMIDVVEAVTAGRAPVVLDLAGGTGSISLRLLRRRPDARTTLLDVDPVLLAIARASVDGRTTIVSADLRHPGWTSSLPRGSYDAVVTATALHWFTAARLTELYAEIRDVLAPGGVFINADHMPDGDLPSTMEDLGRHWRARREALYATGAALSWDEWWVHVQRDPVLGPKLAERAAVFGSLHAVDFSPPLSWHVDALRGAGFGEVGVTWRGGQDAAVTARRGPA